MARLLVTGGAGFIGSNFVHYWLQEHVDDRLVVLDALTYAGNPANLEFAAGNPHYRFVRGDIGDCELVERLLREESIDTVVHFAAESHVDRSITGPAAFIQTNVLGTHSLLEAARKVWLGERTVTRHRFHHVSTDEVYGSLGPEDPPFSESTPYAPNSPYSASKAGSDHLVRAYHHTYGLSTTTSNCSNNYGPLQFPEKLVPLCIVNLLRGKPLPVYGDGLNVRDWLHVRDHCRSIDLVLAGGRVGEVYNVGGRSECQNIELVRELCAIADDLFGTDSALQARFPQCIAANGGLCASSIGYVTDRAGHDRRYAIDCRKIEAELGYRPDISITSGLRATFKWYVDNEPWWRAILDGTYRDLAVRG
ncbi:MAG: rffG 1 [Gammaproteobacteria bacterium]|nr:rffG 1 [Gammaproteobacteria bacterium]